ncbi:hypothetical protein BKA65DRAFT_198615 [Rhexocercosporidium sp. MPI-PUGE-AT-0058]|nr:hypothetical protein BKA65DRAFT_198615 [Rhexocercosporidium sp. MPI-PUGE-AT-0058]
MPSPPVDTAADLPLSTSADLYLAHPTPAECQKIWNSVYPSWGDSFTLPQFLAESAHLLTVPLAKDGGMTLWILVDKTLAPDNRPILASCETFRKKSLLTSARENVGVQDVVLHGIASVFCDTAYRGRGYAQRMMREMGEVLKMWQVGPGERCVGSVLYSDIGKVYYAKLGWNPVGRNSHLEFPAKKRDDGEKSEIESVVLDKDLDELCARDEVLVRQRLAESGKNGLMVVPGEDNMRWHHGKENFICEKVFKKGCPSKGVLVGERDGKNRTWAIWTRRFYKGRESAGKENTLYILRLVFEDQDPTKGDMEKMRNALKIIIRAAQAEADSWGLNTVKLWDPSPLVIELLQGMDVVHRLVEREQDAIASLMWHGDGDVPEWVANEKYAWV